MDARAKRLADNESVFRSINEQIEEFIDRFGVNAEFVCECARLDCNERLDVPLSEYERVRSEEDWFIVVRGHEQPEFERVIEEHGDWLIVQKVGEAGARATSDDPRSG